MDKFKIKEECKKYVAEPFRELTYIKASLGYFEDITDAAIKLKGITDEMFEKVEERIELHQDRYSYGSEKRYGLSKKDFSDYTGRERDLCEGILNVDPELAKKFLKGDLVEKDKPIEKQCFNLNNYNYRHENGMLSVEPIETIPNKSEVPDGLGDGFKITNNTDHEIFVERGLNEMIISEKAKTKHPVEGDELITTDCEKIKENCYSKENLFEWLKSANPDWSESKIKSFIDARYVCEIVEPVKENGTTYYTKKQMNDYAIKKVKEWLLTRQTTSFKEFINSK